MTSRPPNDPARGSASDPRPSLLVVDDDDVFRQRLAAAFEARGYEVRQAPDAESALVAARDDTPELAVIDLRMPGASGIQLLRDLLALDATTNVVVLTAYGSIATAVEAVQLGATHYLTKPADADDIERAFARRADPTADPPPPSEVPTLARVEWEHIHRVLTDCAGNVTQAARLLGIHRRSLQRKLSKYPVPR